MKKFKVKFREDAIVETEAIVEAKSKEALLSGEWNMEERLLYGDIETDAIDAWIDDEEYWEIEEYEPTDT